MRSAQNLSCIPMRQYMDTMLSQKSNGDKSIMKNHTRGGEIHELRTEAISYCEGP